MAALGWLLNLDFAGGSAGATLAADLTGTGTVTADLTTSITFQCDLTGSGTLTCYLRTIDHAPLGLLHHVPHIEDTEVYTAVLDIHEAIDSIAEVLIAHKVLVDSEATIVTKTADFNVSISEGLVLIDASANTVQGTLPLAANNTGILMKFKCINATFTASIISQGGDNLETVATAHNLALLDVITVQSDGTDWWIVSN